MKTLKLQFSSFIIFTAMLVACSTSKNDVILPKQDSEVAFSTVKNTSPVVNQTTKKEFAAFFSKALSTRSKSRLSAASDNLDLSSLNFNFNNAIELNFDNTTAKVVSVSTVTEDGTKYIFSSLYNGSTAMNDGLITKISTVNDVTELSYYDISGVIASKIVINKSGALISAQSFNQASSNARVVGYIGNWAKCVGAVATKMTDGSVIGSVATLGCMAWGGPCAVAVGVGCAISASVNDF